MPHHAHAPHEGREHHVREHAHGLLHKLHEHSPTTGQVVGLLTLLAVGTVVLILGGLTITGVVIALILLTPVFIIFSPILVPAGFVLFLCVAGVVAAGLAAVATVSVISWIYSYFKGHRPPGADHVDYARFRLQDTAEHVKVRARDFGNTLQSKSQEAAPGA